MINNTTIHINRLGISDISQPSITSIISIKDSNSDSVSFSYDDNVLKFVVNKLSNEGILSQTVFDNANGYGYNTDNISEGWYTIKYVQSSETKEDKIYLSKQNYFNGVANNNAVSNDISNSISVTPNVNGVLVIEKISNELNKSYSVIQGYDKNGHEYNLNVTNTYLPNVNYLFCKKDNKYYLYQAVPTYPNEDGLYRYNSTSYTNENPDTTSTYIKHDDVFWYATQVIENNSDLTSALGGITFSNSTSLFIPRQKTSVGERSFNVILNGNNSTQKFSNSTLVKLGYTTYLHGTFIASFQGLNDNELLYNKGILFTRDYYTNLMIELSKSLYYSRGSGYNFDLAFHVLENGKDISEEMGENITAFKITETNEFSSNSYSSSYPAMIKPNSNSYSCQYGLHTILKTNDDYIHASLPYGSSLYNYPGIQISSNSNTDINGFYYFQGSYEEMSNSFNSNSLNLILRHSKNDYSLVKVNGQWGQSEWDGDYHYFELRNNKNVAIGKTPSYEFLSNVNGQYSNFALYQQNSYYYDEDDKIANTELKSTPQPVTISNKSTQKTLKFQLITKGGNIIVYDNGFNLAINDVAPYESYLQLLGSTGNNNYTGYYQKFGRFFPSDFITMEYAASSNLDISATAIDDNDNILFKNKKLENKKLYTSQILLKRNTFSNLKTTINITFIDESGMTSSLQKSIMYAGYLNRLSHENIVENSENLKRGNISLIQVKISDDYYRAWNEIWFPENHQLPLNSDGSINEEQAKRQAIANINGTRTEEEIESYDVAQLTASNALTRDTEGRILQLWDENKTYPDSTNDYYNLTEGLNNDGFTYWIINNNDVSDFRLEFEYFDFSSDFSVDASSRNQIAYNLGYNGDVLVAYDASADGCTIAHNDNGITSYSLADPSKLKRLFAIKGSSKTNITIKDLTDSQLSNSWEVTTNGLITPAINTNRICLIPYTDIKNPATGFKLKAGPQINYQYVNYDINYETGEIWTHNFDNAYQSVTIISNYRYYTQKVNLDLEQGVIYFDNDDNSMLLSGKVYVYNYLDRVNNYIPTTYLGNNEIKTFLTLHDDFQDYSVPVFYCSPNDYYLSSNILQSIYSENDAVPKGRLVSSYYINKDEGHITFNGNVPKGRIFGSYYYHTLDRLTSDGYGDLSFYNNLLVPTNTLESQGYYDWDYVDLKIVNQGTAHLLTGQMKLLARGYISSGTTVDTVLDNNRPWDQQKGSLQQTVQSCGGEFKPTLSALSEANRTNAISAKGKQTITITTLNTKGIGYIRLYWTLASGDSGWINCTRGSKLFSAELAGTYHSFTTG